MDPPWDVREWGREWQAVDTLDDRPHRADERWLENTMRCAQSGDARSSQTPCNEGMGALMINFAILDGVVPSKPEWCVAALEVTRAGVPGRPGPRGPSIPGKVRACVAQEC